MYIRKGILSALFFFVICNLSCRKMFPIEEIEVRGILVDTKDYLAAKKVRVVIYELGNCYNSYDTDEKSVVMECYTDAEGRFDMKFNPAIGRKYIVTAARNQWALADIERSWGVELAKPIDLEEKVQDFKLTIRPFWMLKLIVKAASMNNFSSSISFHNIGYPYFYSVSFQGNCIDTFVYSLIKYEEETYGLNITTDSSYFLGTKSYVENVKANKFDTTILTVYY